MVNAFVVYGHLNFCNLKEHRFNDLNSAKIPPITQQYPQYYFLKTPHSHTQTFINELKTQLPEANPIPLSFF